MRIAENLEGQKFNRLLVLEKTLLKTGTAHYYLCICDCLKYVIVSHGNLRSGHTTSCGCYKKEIKVPDLVGRRFGRLTVIDVYRGKHSVIMYRCSCDCDNQINARRGDLLRGHYVSCGCYNQEIITGASSINWKGGITPENKKIRSSKENILWRKQIFERDKYTCQKCNQIGGQLHAHHISNFSSNKIERFNIHNGITLCKICHNEFHNKYGKHNNDYFQLAEFVYWNNM